MDSKNIFKVLKLNSQETYEFEKVDKNLQICMDKTFKDYLIKWDMHSKFQVKTYKFQNNFKSRIDDQLILDFIQSKILPNISDLKRESSIDSSKELNIEIEPIPCTILSMEFFDRIHENGITLSDGTIKKCFEEYVEDIVVADELRNMLMVEDSDNYEIYKEEERNEFLFRLFQHLCIGGCLNQYEDNIEPYFLMSKELYKELLCVRKVGSEKKTTITSKVYKITIYNGNQPVFPRVGFQHPQDLSYIIINFSTNEITMLKHTW
ncbi:hypothetical protein JTE90_027455 [Oedothorax gibbosus]|uniref:Cilia- and flagella-associated protein 300 n=1 Tax=Oedothorax gibbosus TaxID=931172 RepID=A0AAV6W2A1_9ARAC|nr:hypothetical protein JTE90_027455 [Oedothorax gibbosus]